MLLHLIKLEIRRSSAEDDGHNSAGVVIPCFLHTWFCVYPKINLVAKKKQKCYCIDTGYTYTLTQSRRCAGLIPVPTRLSAPQNLPAVQINNRSIILQDNPGHARYNAVERDDSAVRSFQWCLVTVTYYAM